MIIKFRDLAGNLVYCRKDRIDAICIISPFSRDKNARSFISCGTTTAPVSAETANEVLKELEEDEFLHADKRPS